VNNLDRLHPQLDPRMKHVDACDSRKPGAFIGRAFDDYLTAQLGKHKGEEILSPARIKLVAKLIDREQSEELIAIENGYYQPPEEELRLPKTEMIDVAATAGSAVIFHELATAS
jgi:hypothetical protein